MNDDEQFCPNCYAGMESDQHHSECTMPGELAEEMTYRFTYGTRQERFEAAGNVWAHLIDNVRKPATYLAAAFEARETLATLAERRKWEPVAEELRAERGRRDKQIRWFYESADRMDRCGQAAAALTYRDAAQRLTEEWDY